MDGTMMRLLVRVTSVAALALGLLTAGGTPSAFAFCPEPGQGPPGCQTGPVPEEWGEVNWSHAAFVVVARQNRYLPGQLGNQHVTLVTTTDEEGMIDGRVYDWFCPAGAVAPLNTQEASRCRLKSTRYLEYDDSYVWPGETVYKWAPDMRYVNHRLPVVLYDSTETTVTERGWLSIRLKADGAATQWWYDGDYQSIVEWQGAHVTGGHFLGKAWLSMDSVSVNSYFLIRGYGG